MINHIRQRQRLPSVSLDAKSDWTPLHGTDLASTVCERVARPTVTGACVDRPGDRPPCASGAARPGPRAGHRRPRQRASALRMARRLQVTVSVPVELPPSTRRPRPLGCGRGRIESDTNVLAQRQRSRDQGSAAGPGTASGRTQQATGAVSQHGRRARRGRSPRRPAQAQLHGRPFGGMGTPPNTQSTAGAGRHATGRRLAVSILPLITGVRAAVFNQWKRLRRSEYLGGPIGQFQHGQPRCRTCWTVGGNARRVRGDADARHRG